MNSTLSKFSAALLCATLLAGCSSLTPSEQRMMSGAFIGTAAGAVGAAAMGGCVSCGAVLGAAVGTGTGYVVDQLDK